MMSYRRRNDDENGLNGTEREILQTITQETRANIIQDLLGHPQGSPSMREIEYMNPSKNTATLNEHLDRLIELGFVERIKLPQDERKRNVPHTFYRLTEAGRRFLEDHNMLVDEEEEIEEEYNKVEKTPDIIEAESAQRPL